MHPDKVTLYIDISFLPKVVSEFHVNEPIVLPTFFPSPTTPVERKLHSLDVRRALAFYLHRTKSIRRSQHLFMLPRTTQRCSCFFSISIVVDCLAHSPGLPAGQETSSRMLKGTFHQSGFHLDSPIQRCPTAEHLQSSHLGYPSDVCQTLPAGRQSQK